MTTTPRALNNGTTITIKPSEQGPLVILGNPANPEDLREVEAGRLVDGGFQPAIFSAFALRPETLRAIADLIDEASA